MITEDYVSFETAKLLKGKGFDEQLCHFYTEEGLPVVYKTEEGVVWANNSKSEHAIVQPTLQMAMKWLREVHNVFIDISSRFSKNADKDICFSYSCKKLIDTYKSSYEIGDGEWLNYEDACEAAIKYCLENLI